MHSSSAISEFVLPGSKPHYNPDKQINLVHQTLDLAISLNKKAIVGLSTITADVMENNLHKIAVDAVNMEILEIVINKKAVNFEYDGKIINLELPRKYKKSEKITFSIKYQTVEPQAGAFFVLPNQNYPDKSPELWTQGESETSRYWFPCLDWTQQIGTFRINLRVPDKFTTISNGILVKDAKASAKDDLISILSTIDPEVSAKNYHVYEWQQSVPQPTYLTAVVVGVLDEIKDNYKDIAVNYYTSKGKGGLLKDTAGKTPKMIEFFSKKFGVNFPYAKYFQFFAADFNSGGMENASITINTDRVLSDKKIQKDWLTPEILVAHELVHQWFGDLVIIDHWSHLWIKEGMATYGECMWIEKEYGFSEFQYYRFQDWEVYLEESYKRPIVTNFYRNNKDMYDAHSYPKGGAVYHMIRSILGDLDFELVLKTLLEENKHRTVQSYDLLKIITRISGKNLNWLFDKFLFNSGHPDLAVSFSYDTTTKLAKIEVEQKNLDKDSTNSIYPLKIPVGFNFLNSKNELETTVFEIELSTKNQSYYFPFDKKPDFISFDVNNNLIKELELKFSHQELENQLLNDPDPISRIFAVKALGKTNTLLSLKSLQKAYEQEQFWGVRFEIAKVLKDIKLSQSQSLLLQICEDKNSKVVRQAIISLEAFKNQQVYDFLLKIAQSEPESIFVQAVVLKVLGTLAKYLGTEREQELIQFYTEILETKTSWGERIRIGAIGGLACLNSNIEAVELITKYTKAGVKAELRNAAVANLGVVSVNQEKPVVDKILDLLAGGQEQDNYFLESSTITALSQIKLPRSISILQQIKHNSVIIKSERHIDGIIETISKSFEDKNNLEDLRKKMDKITEDNIVLKGKLEEFLAVQNNHLNLDKLLPETQTKKSKKSK